MKDKNPQFDKASSPTEKIARGFGLIIIGSEILDGRIRDQHFDNFRNILQLRNHFLAYSATIIDSPELICSQLRWAFNRDEPFFCCGGIGATPDDYTRQAVAEVTGRPLDDHPDAARIIRGLVPPRRLQACLEMGRFPKGADLIPNPINRIPGFSIDRAYFLPGFPRMAAGMAEWILDTYFEKGPEQTRRAFRLPGSREADLVHLMRNFVADYPDIIFSSLPRFVREGFEVIITLQGSRKRVGDGAARLIGELKIKDIRWEEYKAV